MTTLEKMADAILNDLLGRKGVGDELIAIEDDDPEIWKEIKQAVARAALKELRVPSEAMLRAAWENESGVTEIWECGKQLERLKRDYQSMIDAILEESE